MNTWNSVRQTAMAAWQQRAVREQRLLALGGIVLVCAMVWIGLLAPAWQVWHEAPSRQADLDTQTRHMLQLQAEARQLQAPQRIERVEALKLLGSSAQQLLGPGAQLNAQGDELRVTLQAASANGLAEWLAQARDKAQALPRLAQLQKQEPSSEPAPRAGKTPDTPAGVTWSGTLVLRIP
ncbi:MAG: type II secretion system protein GspM [Limnohabitans sp.]